MTAGPQPTIRPARADDMAALGRLGALLVALHHEFDADRFLERTPRTEASYAHYLEGEHRRPGVVILVAETEGAVAGYVYAGVEGHDYMALRGPAGVVHDLVVDPAQRGTGLGRALMHAVLEALVSHGAPRVVLSTAAGNEPAQRLFAALGFRPTMIEMTRETS